LAAQKADTFLWRNSIICVVTCPPATPLLSVASNKNEDLHLKFFFFLRQWQHHFKFCVLYLCFVW
jgi:hypothetical protein